MPEAERPVMEGQPARPTRQHHWVGGGVPKSVAVFDTLEGRGWKPGLELEVSADPPRVVLHNTAGHALPTADPERHLRVEARVEAADGTVVAREVLRLGQRWDWGDAATGRVASRISDSRLQGGEARTWTPNLTRVGGARLVVEVLHVRLTPANADGMARATMDAELRGYWPEAPALLPEIRSRYPLASYIARDVVDLATGATRHATIPELIADSKALATLSAAEQARRLDTP